MIKKMIFMSLIILSSYGCGPHRRGHKGVANSALSKTINTKTPIVGYLQGSEVDTYKVLLKKNKSYIIKTFQLSSGMDTIIRIFTADGLLIAENDNFLITKLESKINLKINQTGEYCILVTNKNLSATTEMYSIIIN